MDDQPSHKDAPVEHAPGMFQNCRGQFGRSMADKGERIQPNKHRKVQVARTGGRKLFRGKAQQLFLEWFAATCNVSLSAEKAGFNYKTVLRHRMNDPRFAEGWQRAVEQAYARLEAKQLETRAKETPIGIEGDWDAPEMEEMDPERAERLLALHRKEAKHPELVRRQGRRPTVASNAEVKTALLKALKAFEARVKAREGEGSAGSEDAPPPRSTRSPSPSNEGEDQG